MSSKEAYEAQFGTRPGLWTCMLVKNRTLGFGKVFAIGFPGRKDRRDTLVLASSLTDIDIEWSDAVPFNDIPTKGIHKNWYQKDVNNSGTRALIGSQRAHFNVMQKMIEQHISTALILEDDQDWEYHIKDQVEAVAQAFRSLQEDLVDKTTNKSPYGDSWDMLWLGHCRAAPHNDEENIVILGNDPTVPPTDERHSSWYQQHVPPEVISNTTRLAFELHKGMCTFGYGVTLKGAQKVLAGLALAGSNRPFDTAMNDMCRGAINPPFRCYGVYPPIFSTHRFAGSEAKDSDLSTWSAAKEHVEYTFDIVYSVIQNAARLLQGSKTVKSQWPGSTYVGEMPINETINYDITPTRIIWKDLPLETDHIVQRPKWGPEQLIRGKPT
ncbi:hypothetical protein LTS08_004457 [Lithohypha guttulata]|nr:hypothetical protein LTS08_004457 [Lithohypha guttulata]